MIGQLYTTRQHIRDVKYTYPDGSSLIVRTTIVEYLDKLGQVWRQRIANRELIDPNQREAA